MKKKIKNCFAARVHKKDEKFQIENGKQTENVVQSGFDSAFRPFFKDYFASRK